MTHAHTRPIYHCAYDYIYIRVDNIIILCVYYHSVLCMANARAPVMSHTTLQRSIYLPAYTVGGVHSIIHNTPMFTIILLILLTVLVLVATVVAVVVPLSDDNNNNKRCDVTVLRRNTDYDNATN